MLQPRFDTMPTILERTHPVSEKLIRMIDGSYVTAGGLATRFYDSDYGIQMRDQPLRYSVRYGYDRDQMLDDNGHDLCPVGHQIETAYHLGRILDREQDLGTLYGELPEESVGILAFTLMTHDIGEPTHEELGRAGLTAVGDIPSGLKTDTDRLNEAKIRYFFYKRLFSDVDPTVIDLVEAVISHRDTTHLHDLFQATHAVQAFETADYAYHRLMETVWAHNGETIIPLDDGGRRSALLGISRIVFDNAREELKNYAYLTHVQEVLERSRAIRATPHVLLN